MTITIYATTNLCSTRRMGPTSLTPSFPFHPTTFADDGLTKRFLSCRVCKIVYTTARATSFFVVYVETRTDTCFRISDVDAIITVVRRSSLRRRHTYT